MRKLGSCFAERFFRHVALSYILHCTYVLRTSVIAASMMSDQVQVLNRTVRHNDPVLIFKIVPSVRSLDHVVKRRNVVGMNSAGDHIQRHCRTRLELENAIHWLRPNDLVGHHPPPKISHAGEMLALGQKRLAPAQFFFPDPSAGDVLNRRKVFEFSVVIPGGPCNGMHVPN
jgi:hypothetical protein